jgi:hypothetical protein
MKSWIRSGISTGRREKQMVIAPAIVAFCDDETVPLAKGMVPIAIKDVPSAK